MIARLGFSIIITLAADILLSTSAGCGGARFQAKCHQALREFRSAAARWSSCRTT